MPRSRTTSSKPLVPRRQRPCPLPAHTGLVADEPDVADLPGAQTLREALEGPEQRIIERALELNDGNRKRTAAMLGVNRTTLFNKMRKYGLLDWPAAG